jgi:hypothetical protein
VSRHLQRCRIGCRYVNNTGNISQLQKSALVPHDGVDVVGTYQAGEQKLLPTASPSSLDRCACEKSKLRSRQLFGLGNTTRTNEN